MSAASVVDIWMARLGEYLVILNTLAKCPLVEIASTSAIGEAADDPNAEMGRAGVASRFPMPLPEPTHPGGHARDRIAIARIPLSIARSANSSSPRRWRRRGAWLARLGILENRGLCVPRGGSGRRSWRAHSAMVDSCLLRPPLQRETQQRLRPKCCQHRQLAADYALARFCHRGRVAPWPRTATNYGCRVPVSMRLELRRT